MEHRAWSIGKYSWQIAAGSIKTEVGSQRSEERNSLVGAAFSRDLAISTNFLIF
jgi:hypothetical protein